MGRVTAMPCTKKRHLSVKEKKGRPKKIEKNLIKVGGGRGGYVDRGKQSGEGKYCSKEKKDARELDR